MDVRVISIGALACHPLWNERHDVRTGHATTTLIRSRDRVILVDPGLPAPALVARLGERAGLRPEDVTDVFLTSFRADTCRAMPAFEDARWWISEAERESVGVPLAQRLRDAGDADDETREELELRIGLLQRCKPAPDHITEGVDLFPLPGVTPGLCGLLIADARRTTLVCGDAVPTIEHLEQGQVLPRPWDVDRARESFAEAVEIADVLVLGRDNIVNNPLVRGV